MRRRSASSHGIRATTPTAATASTASTAASTATTAAIGAIVAVACVLAACGAERTRPEQLGAGTAAPGGPTAAMAAAAAAATPAPAPTVRAPAAPSSPTSLVVATSAEVTAPASRVPVTPAGTCQRIAAAVATGEHATASQLVIVHAPRWSDTVTVLQVADRSGTGWICGPELLARVGTDGMRPFVERRSGDGTTPAGVFGLGTMTAWDGEVFSFFGTSPDPGVRAGAYRRSRPTDCFGATPGDPGYGHLRSDTSCSSPDELLARIGAYTHAALIDANMEPDVSGDAPGEIPYASAIFLHRHSYADPAAGVTKPTSGCVSLAQEELTSVLLQLRRDVRFAIGTTDWLLAGAR